MAIFRTFSPGQPKPKSPLEKYKEKLALDTSGKLLPLPEKKASKRWKRLAIVLSMIVMLETYILYSAWRP